MENYTHIFAEKRFEAELDDRRRLIICRRDIWIPTKRLDPLFETIDYVLMSQDQLLAPGMLIHGGGGYGKSAIIKRLEQLYSSGNQRIKAIGVGEDMDGSKLRDLICDAFDIKITSARNNRERTSKLLNAIKSQNYCALLIDELHDTGFKTLSQQNNSLSLMKHLAGPPCYLCLICFGDERAQRVLENDEQILRRYVYWPLNAWTNDQDFCDFVATYECHLPLKLPSNLASMAMRQKLIRYSFGVMDNVVKILKACAMDAIVTKTEKITTSQINGDMTSFCARYGLSLVKPKTSRSRATR